MIHTEDLHETLAQREHDLLICGNLREADEILAEIREIEQEIDCMDAPSDWDAGTVCFDPYI